MIEQNEGFGTERDSLRWIEILASLASIIGIAGLVALMAEGANAASPQGFKPGAKTFSNPFANAQGAPAAGNLSNEDEAANDDPAQAPPSQRGAQQASRAGATPSNGAGTGNAGAGGKNGISLGGGPPSGVIPNPKEPAPLSINDETGEGSREQVTDFNFPDADILDIAKALGKLTGKNFILDKDVKGRITIISNGSITVGDAWKAFLTALDINGFALIPSGKYIRIARQRDARDKQLKTYTGAFSPDTDALITRVFPLKYINAEEVARTFRSFMPANSRIIPYEQTNTVIVTDTGSNIAKLNKMLEILDVEGYDAGIEVIPVKYASAADLSKLIDQLLPGTGSPTGGAGVPRFGGGGAGGGHFNARRTKEGGIINTIIADDRTNTLIVHANTKGADQVRELVAKLDQKLPAPQGGGKVHVYYLQFADAEAVATTLNNLSQGGGAAKPPTAAGGGTGTNPIAASLFEGAIKISPDKTTNSLVVTASPSDYEVVRKVIDRLDIQRDEVYVEVTVLEVDLTNSSVFSANIANPTSGLASITSPDLVNFVTNPIGTQGLLLGLAAGGQQTLTVNGTQYTVSSVQGLIRALATNTKTNILANPQIIALDNEDALFDSTEKIPVPSTTTTATGLVNAGVTYTPVTLSIKITPHINKLSNFVKLKVENKLGSLDTANSVTLGGNPVPANLDRTTSTTVVVGDSDTVVLGGLIRDQISDTVTKIPLLGDIPLLGWLFKSKTTQNNKTNLLVFITPHIIRQYDKVRKILDQKLKDRDDYLEANTGGDDPLRSARDRMIRRLPDIEALSTSKPKASVSIGGEEGTGETKNTSPFTGEIPTGKAPATSPVNPAVPAVPAVPAAPAAPSTLAPESGNSELAPPTAPPVGVPGNAGAGPLEGGGG